MNIPIIASLKLLWWIMMLGMHQRKLKQQSCTWTSIQQSVGAFFGKHMWLLSLVKYLVPLLLAPQLSPHRGSDKYCRFTEYYYFGHIFLYIGFLFPNPVHQELQALKFSNDLLACTRGESVNLIQGFCLFLISYHASMPLTPWFPNITALIGLFYLEKSEKHFFSSLQCSVVLYCTATGIWSLMGK